MRSPWPYFTIEEVTCKCGCGEMNMDGRFMRTILEMRKELDFPFIITSGYRCPEYNDYLYTERGELPGEHLNGPHTTGRALDIQISHARADRLIEASYKYKMTGRGIYQRGNIHGRFIHIDNLPPDTHPRPRIWSY